MEEKNYFWDFRGGKPSERGVNFLVQNGAYRRRISAVKGEKALFFVGIRGDVHTDSYVQPPSVSSTLFHTLPSAALL